MDKLLQRIPEAQANLRDVPPEIQEELGARVLQLGHVDLYDITRTAWDDRHTPIPEEAYTVEQQAHSDRVNDLIVGVTELLAPAHVIAEERKISEPDGYFYGERYDPFSIGRDIAFERALAAHEDGDSTRVHEQLELMVVLGLMSTQTCDEQIRSAVATGMAADVVDVLGNMQGLIYLNPPGRQTPVVSVEFCAGQSADMLRLATNQDFNESFQHRTPLVEPGVTQEKTEVKKKLMDGLRPTELLALAHHSDRVLHNSDTAAHLALEAASRLVHHDNYEHPDSAETADIIASAVDFSRATRDESIVLRAEQQLKYLRAYRSAGNSHYRGNDRMTATLDSGLAELSVQGRADIVKELISSTPHELPDTVEEALVDKSSHNLTRALSYLRPGTTAEEYEQAVKLIIGLQQEKRADLQHQLIESGAPQETIDTIIDTSYDPDSAFDTPPEFWNVVEQLHEGEKLIVFGDPSSSSSRIAERARLVLDLRKHGIKPELLPAYFCNAYDRVPKSQQPMFVERLGIVSDRLLPEDIKDYEIRSQKQRIFEALMQFTDPGQAVELLAFINPSLDSSTATSVLIKVFDSTYRGYDAKPIELSDQEIGVFVSVFSRIPRLGEVCMNQQEQMTPIVNELIQSEDAEQRIEQITEALNSESGIRQVIDEYFEGVDALADFYERLLIIDDPARLVNQLANAIMHTGLAELVSEQGPAYGLRASLLQSVMASEDYVYAAKQIVDVFEGGGSLWHTTSQLAEMSIGMQFYAQGATASRFPISLPNKNVSDYIEEAITYVEGDSIAAVLRDTYGMSEQSVADALHSDGVVMIEHLPQEAQITLLTAYLYEAVTMSRNLELRQTASERNSHVTAAQIFRNGNLHHVSHARHLAAILQNGLLPGEFVASRLRADSFPFNVDLVASTSDVLQKGTFGERLNALASRGFGELTVHVLRGDVDEYRHGAEFTPGWAAYDGQHRLIPGGFPATEISAVSLSDPADFQTVKAALVEVGIFIPIFDKDGEQLYDFETYEAERQDGNYEVITAEIIDTQFMRPGSKAGSNEGAEFIIPGRRAGEPSSRYYCKFASPESAEHIWSELLTDQIYRAVSPRLVPETKAVILEGRLARASRMVEADDLTLTNEARNAGFILDALVGNWDATFNAANLLPRAGVGMRIDTGNALFFRARGDRKPDGQFGPIVQELERGANPDSLGGGMRQNYPGLTVQEIGEQAEELELNLTDQKIDEIVDSVRMGADMRNELKQILKSRRDYIIKWAAQVGSGERTLV